MGLGAIIGNFFKSFFDKVGSFIKKMWNLTSPFVNAILSREGKVFWNSSQELIIQALKIVKEKGLPTTEAKQKEFAAIMTDAAKDKWTSIKESEQGWMRETGLLILKELIEKGFN